MCSSRYTSRGPKCAERFSTAKIMVSIGEQTKWKCLFLLVYMGLFTYEYFGPGD